LSLGNASSGGAAKAVEEKTIRAKLSGVRTRIMCGYRNLATKEVIVCDS
jgi:hypothetical protein